MLQQTNKLYVGGLNTSHSVAILKKALSEVFGDFGKVEDVFILVDKETRKPRGSAFVTMSSPDEARNAQRNLNKAELLINDEDPDPRVIAVNFARPKPEEGEKQPAPTQAAA